MPKGVQYNHKERKLPKERKMSKYEKGSTPQEYLTKVLTKWRKFCEAHKLFAVALKKLLQENEQLKKEIVLLKGK